MEGRKDSGYALKCGFTAAALTTILTAGFWSDDDDFGGMVGFDCIDNLWMVGFDDLRLVDIVVFFATRSLVGCDTVPKPSGIWLEFKPFVSVKEEIEQLLLVHNAPMAQHLLLPGSLLQKLQVWPAPQILLPQILQELIQRRPTGQQPCVRIPFWQVL